VNDLRRSPIIQSDLKCISAQKEKTPPGEDGVFLTTAGIGGGVKLAEQPDALPELREQLLQMARDWMKATMKFFMTYAPRRGAAPMQITLLRSNVGLEIWQ
jgi:hypothetical protein